ncbi:MAG: radical SAM protein, partial [Steroidobacteraceae bacterium]|nr:radical SAM protein [Steroidobacteraceae bacterium]
YCTYPLIEGSKSRLRDPAQVADEFMALCARQDVGHLFIVDSVFNLPLRHAKEVCRELVARGNRTPWTSYVNPVAFDDELAELMVRAGAMGMEIGSDSGCDEMLDRLEKGFRTDNIRQLSAIAEDHGLRDCHSFILGTTGETLEHVERTLDFVEDLDPFAAVMLVWVGDHEVVNREIALDRRQFRDEIYERIGRRAGRQPRWIVPKLGIRFDPRAFAALRKLGLRGPLWQHLDRLPAREFAAGAGNARS